MNRCKDQQFYKELYHIVHQSGHGTREEREERKPVLPPAGQTPVLF